MIDILFDFSVSRYGGGLRRLHSYMEYFKDKTVRTLFIIHPDLVGLASKIGIDFECRKRNPFSRFYPDKKLEKKYHGRTKIFFSYGIPISRKIGFLNYLHLSNALPFDYENCSVAFSDLLKNYLLRVLFKIFKQQDIVCAESDFTISVYKKRIGWYGDSFVSRNGSDDPMINTIKKKEKMGNYMVTIGTERYKRLDHVYEIFSRIKNNEKVDKLLIIGNQKKIPLGVANKNDVQIMNIIPRNEVLSILQNSGGYITASEIENSSNALIEAMQLCPKVIMSSIPSHHESVDTEGKDLLRINNRNFYIVNKAALRELGELTWEKSIQHLISHINVELKKLGLLEVDNAI
jgi:glycosyltransferase involved in cell wall biosynthesis